MEISPADLKVAFVAAMRRFVTTVTVVTVGENGERFGMTATAVASVTTDPPAILICVNRAASIHANMRINVPFCVNILATSHGSLSRAFSGKLSGGERFSVGQWDEDTRGRPYLMDAQANLFCAVDATVDYGTHTIFIGKVDAIRLHGDVDPLIYGDGKYITT